MSKEINALAVSGLSSAAITLAEGAEAHRANLLTIAKGITEVDEFTLDAASDALKLLQETARAVEKQRVKEKAPALDFGRKIDDCAKGYTVPINAEADRLSRLIGAYLGEQERKAREAAAARQKAIAEAAAAAIPDEDFPDMPESTPPPAPAFPAPLPPPVIAPKVAGIQTRTSFAYEVEDIAALYAARPDLVKLEPKHAAILEALKADKPIPGLRYWQETTATSRK